MSPFVRFIFLLVILGVSVNLAIVLLANSQSQKKQALDTADEQEQFNAAMTRFNGRQRRCDIAVEWQKIDAHQKVLETSLLVRTYTVNSADQREPLPLIHVTIPGDKVSVDGLLLSFPPSFTDQYAVLRDMKFAYFDHIYADSQTPEARFSLLTHADPPAITRMNPDRVTHYETQFWRYVWDLLDATTKPNKPTVITVSTPAASRVVEPGLVYSFYLSNFDSVPAIEVNTDPGLLYDMEHETPPADHP